MMRRISMYMVGVLVAGLVLVLSPVVKAGKSKGAAAKGVKKYAVLVGIGKYRHPGVPNLSGPPKDVDKMVKFLRRVHHFTQIKVLKDSQATKKDIQKAMRWLARVAGPNDVAVFYFSGHGSRVDDTNGDESDRMDETLIPYDVGASPSSHLIDDEIGVWIKTVRSNNLTVILDSCHSGTGYKSLSIVAKASRAKYWDNPYMKGNKKGYIPGSKSYNGFRGIVTEVRQSNAQVNRAQKPRPRRRVRRNRRRFSFLAASLSSERAYDVGGRVNSVMTHYLVAFGSRFPNESLAQLVRRMNAALVRRDGSRQWPMTPNAEGVTDQPLFSAQSPQGLQAQPQLETAPTLQRTSATRCRGSFCVTLNILNRRGYPTSKYKNHQEIMFTFQLTKPGYIALIGEDANGAVTVLFPDVYNATVGRRSRHYYVRKTHPVMLPPGGWGSKAAFKIKGKVGSVESVTLIASRVRADFMRLYKAAKTNPSGKAKIYVEIRDRIQRRQRQRRRRHRRKRRGRMIAVTLQYTIVR